MSVAMKQRTWSLQLCLAIVAIAIFGGGNGGVASGPDFCADSRGRIQTIAQTCPEGTAPFKAAGVNIYDAFWQAWAGRPNTTMMALRDLR